MRPESLSWKLLPPIGGEPANVAHDKGHLTYRGAPALVAVDERVLLWGGLDAYGKPLSGSLGLTIDTSNGTVTSRWEVDWTRGDHASLIDGQVVVLGPGSGPNHRALVFDPDRPEEAQEYVSPIERRWGPAPAQCGQLLMVWGGSEAELRGDANFADGAVFDTDSRTWSLLPEAPLCARRSHVTQAVGDQVVVWGGYTWKGPRDTRPLADGAVHDIGSGDWRPMPSSPLSARADVSSAALKGRVFMSSGSSTNGKYPADGALFDPGDDTWSLLPKAPVRKPVASAFAFDDLVLLTGGTYTGGRSVSLLVYSASANCWVVPDLPEFVPTSFVRLGDGDVYAWSSFDSRTEHALLRSIPVPASASANTAAVVASHNRTGDRAVEVDPDLVEYMAGSSGAVHLQLQRAHDVGTAMAAMDKARTALFTLPHPEEPEDPLPSFASQVALADDGPTFWFDIADAEVHDGTLEQILTVIVSALEGAGATGCLTTPDLSVEPA